MVLARIAVRASAHRFRISIPNRDTDLGELAQWLAHPVRTWESMVRFHDSSKLFTRA